MAAPLVVVTGTGTGIGKTHVSVALVRAWAAGGKRIAGWKPVETGIEGPLGPDGQALQAASTLHVKHSQASYRQPLSPHLAARLENRPVPLAELAAAVREIREEADGVVVELAGGLFSPLSDEALSADWIATLAPTKLILVAPNRLGVLHDVLAVLRSAPPLELAHIVLSAVEVPDSSSPSNAAELRRFTKIPVTEVARKSPEVLVDELRPLLPG